MNEAQARTLWAVSNANHRRPKRARGRAISATERELAAAEQEVHELSTAEPLDVDGIRSVGVGIAMWAVAGLVLLLLYRDDLAASGSQWWLWTCLAGVGLGLLGWVYCRRRRDHADR